MNMNLIFGIVGVVVAIIGVVIISTILQSDLLTQTWVNSFTGLRPIAQLIPLALIGAVIAFAVTMFRGGGRGG